MGEIILNLTNNLMSSTIVCDVKKICSGMLGHDLIISLLFLIAFDLIGLILFNKYFDKEIDLNFKKIKVYYLFIVLNICFLIYITALVYNAV